MTLSGLFYTGIFALIIYALWRHMGIGQKALILAHQHTKKNGVKLLDQSVHLKSVKICRSHSSLITLRRLYEFEFSTRGDHRYKGSIIFIGNAAKNVELEAFVVDDEFM